jgi:hypothetical protein
MEILNLLDDHKTKRKTKAADSSAHGKLKRKQDVLKLVEALKTYKRRKAYDTSTDGFNAVRNDKADVFTSNEQVEDGEQWNNDEWYWDEQCNTWVFTGPNEKGVRI